MLFKHFLCDESYTVIPRSLWLNINGVVQLEPIIVIVLKLVKLIME